ncbi:MAG: type II toxin-antitoxin system RelE/ParE family toxin [Ferruginibacter sp.]|nr:type II toxin-antitoxin system RelE/ParE family toxin [Bacteroidota bacterium]MBX2934631.1 type II toxin-antitoxin system RelE/ParE family toxin [Ferruginibacter sp.]
MARQIIWTVSAQSERREILKYWIKRNKSKFFSRKLNKLIVTALREISKNPQIGRKTNIENVRVKIIRNYLIFYEISPRSIFVLSIWDGRRDNFNRDLK